MIKKEICKVPGCQETTGYTTFCCDRHLPEYFGVEIKQTPTKGLGLFATKTFAKGERISYFGGEIISMQDLCDREDSSIQDTSLYAIQITKKWCCDEQFSRSPCAYSNDSIDLSYLYSQVLMGVPFRQAYHLAKKKDRPNACAHPDMYLFAVEKIEPGEEILWNYGHSYWEGHNVIKKFFSK